MAQNDSCMSVEEARQQIMDPRYIIDEFAGAGAMACVYKARERGTPNIYALKILREEYQFRKGFLEVFEREAQHMRDLQYPNMVRFYKFVNEEHIAYILMDYVEGEALTPQIRQARSSGDMIPIPKIVRIMAQIARAINYLHSEGFIHRDIKPGNILLVGENQSAFLTDLGIVGAFDSQAELGGAGTPSYMPYEQQVGGDVDHTVDIYAFAIMLFEVFSGQKPFLPPKGLNVKQARTRIRELHRNGEMPSLVALRPELPEEIDEIFQHALAKDPSERYRDVMDFAQDIHEILQSRLPDDLKNFSDIRPQEIERSVPEPPAPEVVVVEVVRNTKTVLFIGIAAIVMIMLVVIGGIWINSQSSDAEITLMPTVFATIVPSEVVTDLPTEIISSPTASPTPFLNGESVSILLEDVDALGLGENLNAGLIYAVQHGGTFVPLRLDTSVNGFQVEFSLADGTQGKYSSYGLIFRFQDDMNYLSFRIVSSESRWLLESVEEGVVNLIASAAIEGDLPLRLSVKGLDSFFILHYGDVLIQQEIGIWETGALLLWLETEAIAEIDMAYLQISTIGELDSSSLILPELNRMDYILNDILALQATSDASAVVQCPQFIVIYDGLASYQDELSANFEVQISEFARQAEDISAFIYGRCEIDGQDSALDFNDSFSDYLNWDNNLVELIVQIEAAQ